MQSERVENETGYTLEELIETYGSIDNIPTAAWTFPESARVQDLITAQDLLLATGTPRRYRKSRARQIQYREGFIGGFEGRPGPDAGFEEDLKRHQGNAAWLAYEHGYKDGHRATADIR